MTDWYVTRYGIRLPDGSMATTLQGQPWAWNTRDEAERAIEYFQTYAQRIGVTDWQGEVVRQLSTPWIGLQESADGLVEELTRWLEQQIGGGS